MSEKSKKANTKSDNGSSNEKEACQRSASPFNDESVNNNLSKIKHKIVVMSGKGGVGKSTVATNLACALSRKGYSVGLLDVDIHGPNIPKMLNIESEVLTADDKGMFPIEVNPKLKVISMAFLLQDNQTPVIWRGPVKMSVIRQFLGEVHWGNLDFLVIDLPPGTGDEPLSIAQLIPNGDAVIVTTPQQVALLDVRKAITFTRTVNMGVIGIIENMSGFVCPHCKKPIEIFKSGSGEGFSKEMNVPFLGRIPMDPRIAESGDSGKPPTLSDDDTEASDLFREVVSKVVAFYEKKA